MKNKPRDLLGVINLEDAAEFFGVSSKHLAANGRGILYSPKNARGLKFVELKGKKYILEKHWRDFFDNLDSNQNGWLMEKLMTTKEAGEILNLAPDKIRDLFEQGKLTGYIVSQNQRRRTLRFSPKDIMVFLESARQGAEIVEKPLRYIPDSRRIC